MSQNNSRLKQISITVMGAVIQRKTIDYVVLDIFHHQLNSVKSIDLTEFEPNQQS